MSASSSPLLLHLESNSKGRLYRMLMWYFLLLGFFWFTFLILVFICCCVSVYIQDIVDLCDISQSQPQDATNSVHSLPSWKALILLVPVRLGAEKMNSVYGSCLTALLTFENCIGIIGGRPKHSLYFVGYQGKLLLYTANSSTFLMQVGFEGWDSGKINK